MGLHLHCAVISVSIQQSCHYFHSPASTLLFLQGSMEATSVSIQTDPEPEHNRFLVLWSDISASSNKEHQTGDSTAPSPQKENKIHHCVLKITFLDISTVFNVAYSIILQNRYIVIYLFLLHFTAPSLNQFAFIKTINRGL